MNSLTKKLFDKLSNTKQCVEVNSQLLSYLSKFGDLKEYKDLVGSVEDPVGRTENLKKLVFKLYNEHRLKDLEFFKYLVWSDQGYLCKLIGYGDKQIEKLMKDKPTEKQSQRPSLNIPSTADVDPMESEPDTGSYFT